MILRLALALTVAFLSLSPNTARAWSEGALKVADPYTYAPNNLSLRDFKLGEGGKAPVQYEWITGSFEWTRVDKKFVVPRAKVRLSTSPTAKVIYQKQYFFPNAQGKVDVPVALTQERYTAGPTGDRNEIVVEDPVTHQNARLPIVFTGKNIKPAITLDTNCSGPGLIIKARNLRRSWVYVMCRTIHPATDHANGVKLDIDVYWEMEGSPGTIQVNNQTIDLTDGLTASIATDSKTPNFSFSRGKENPETFELEVHLPERFHPLSVALGLGPYSHQNQTRAYATLYASYYFNEAMKLAAFGAFPVRADPEVDLGLYFIAEQARALDERLILNLLLGFHTLSFVPGAGPAAISGGGLDRRFSFSAPQGIELIFRDFLAKRQNLSYGLFYYPTINNRAYFNSWLRYGSSTFLELNFIQWQEPVGNDTFGAKSFGLSIGFPLFRIL
ncbi:MAG: hypothetical protein JST80_11745 [Bdellovibrionales bacterium]|nr:hypothetical protein [Bdellovibrionales bacterium]